MTFYSNVKQFDNILEDDKIKVLPLLDASRGIVNMIDLFGTAFRPVKSDVNGNIEKLKQKYDEDPDKFVTLDAMLDDELSKKSKKLAIDGGLWLNRGLMFLSAILHNLHKDYKAKIEENKDISDSLKLVLSNAYETTLKKYHGWFAQKMFSGVSGFAPYRSALEKKLSLEKDQGQLYTEMEAYLSTMSPVLERIHQLYIEKGISVEDIKA